MARASRMNTAAGERDFVEKAQLTHESLLDLSADEVEAFNRTVASREYDTWTEQDLVTAGKLARVTVEMERLWESYCNGTDDDAFTRWNKLFNAYQRMQNILGLSASQRPSVGRKVDQRARNENQAKKKRQLAAVSDLIAKPS